MSRRRGHRSGLKRLRRALGIRSARERRTETLPPDFDASTARIVRAVAGYTMTGPERLQSLVNAVRYVVANGIEGDFVECGVWRGGSTMAMAMTLLELGETRRKLYLYDTYEGMNAPTEEDVDIHGRSASGEFAERRVSAEASDWCRSPIDEVRANLAGTGYPADRMHFVEGKVEDTIPARMPPGAIALLRLDTDWYESTRHELEHLYPKLVERGVLVLDDYGHWQGARRAVDEYIAQHGLCLLLNRVDYTARIAVKPG